MAFKARAKTPWGMWFVNVLESSYESTRLDRGWSYMRNGYVKALEMEGSRVTARVSGTYIYTVTFSFPVLKQNQVDKIIALAKANPMIVSELSAGRLPDYFAEKLMQEKIDLVPKNWRSVHTNCSCPDWGDPCKHRAAVFYLLAEYIDNDPFILFTLRGVPLREYFSGTRAKSKADVAGELFPEDMQRCISYSAKRPPVPSEEPRLLPSVQYTGIIQALLPPSPVWAGPDFTSAFMALYHSVTADDHVLLNGTERQVEAVIDNIYYTKRWAHEYYPLRDGLPSFQHREHWLSGMDYRGVLLEGKNGDLCCLTVHDSIGDDFICSVGEAVYHLLYCTSSEGSPGYRFLFYLARLVRSLWKAGAFIPAPGTYRSGFFIYWKPFALIPEVKECLANLALYEPKFFKKGAKTVSAESACELLVSQALTELVRMRAAKIKLKDNTKNAIAWLFFRDEILRTSSPKTALIPERVKKWLSPFYIDFAKYRYRFVISKLSVIEPDETQQPAEDNAGNTGNAGNTVSTVGETLGAQERNLAYSLALQVEIGDEMLSLNHAIQETDNYGLLAVPHALSNYIPDLLELGNNECVLIDEKRLSGFFDEAFPILAELGIDVVLPREIHRLIKPRLVLAAKSKKCDMNLTTYATLEAMASFEWRIALGDETVSLSEFEKLLENESRIVQFNNMFLVLSLNEASALLKKARQKKKPDAQDFLKEYFSGNACADEELQKKLTALFSEESPPLPAAINATLRQYQERGYRWAYTLLKAGFGAIIADDMGLGKTLQAITVLARLREEGLLAKRGVLVIAPAALLANWEAEFAKFAPCFSVYRHHGAARDFSQKADVYLTTYQTAVRDKDIIMEKDFAALVVDEAHILKNPETAIAKTVKAIPAAYKLALSGTPVENKLEDLRSLFDFILPGYLGTPESFKAAYRIPIEVDRSKVHAEVLRRITAPFLLRRLKTDKSIISDLPEKIEIDEYAQLTKKQAALYQAVLDDALYRAELAEEPFEKAGIILQLLLHLKQICDHPRVFDKTSEPEAELSGKAELLVELLRTLFENNEKVLVFSQYVEALTVLQTILLKEFEEKVPLYHGGLSQKAREAVIDGFQNGNTRLLLISLKAGGLGLNLTAASRVIHYDLWFNPAVEAQATDRAYRIGQSKNVFVHRFLTKNTFEERINEMLESKKELAAMTVGTGEAWLANMDKTELEALFALR